MINKYLKIYEPVIELIRDGMHHFDSCILEESFPSHKKEIMINLFKTAF